MNTTAIGRRGEDRAAFWLQGHGFEVIERNWKTRWCEIDIVAQKDGILYFVEVKYRRNANFGAGLEHISAKKQAQMGFAAEFWLQNHRFDGDITLAVVALDGQTDNITFIDEL